MTERFGLPAYAVEQIRQVLYQQPKVDTVRVYGSRARGDYRPNSDVDICITGRNMDLAELIQLENQLDDLLLPWTIDLVLQESLKNPQLLANIERDGVAL